jgi:hypothetical protein
VTPPILTRKKRVRFGLENGYRREVSTDRELSMDGCRLTGSGVRDDVVIATKYTANVKDLQADKYPVQINRSGNSYKSMMVSLEDSLKKLGTTYVDILCECRVSDGSHDESRLIRRHALVGLDHAN